MLLWAAQGTASGRKRRHEGSDFHWRKKIRFNRGGNMDVEVEEEKIISASQHWENQGICPYHCTSSSSEKLHFAVRDTMTGMKYSIKIDGMDLVVNLKRMLRLRGIDPSQCRLIHNGKFLKDLTVLQTLGINRRSVIALIHIKDDSTIS
mmetsp:Transcript_16243/g.24485  ORF Transcript_16243/g.24485 Transcript_16243/m.24485 type:complete len:149 (-) Transcript_16243:299-745(-)